MQGGLSFFKTYKYRIAILLSLCFLASSPARASETLVFSVMSSPEGYLPKVSIALLGEALRRHGKKIEVHYLPAERALRAANTGLLDGDLHRTRNLQNVTLNAYPNLIRVEYELMTMHLAAFSLDPKLSISSYDEMKGHSISYMIGRKNLAHALNELLPETQIYAVSSDEIAFKMMKNKRASFAVTESLLAKIMKIQQPKFNDIHEVGRLQAVHMYSYLNKKHEKLAQKLPQTYMEMEEEGLVELIKIRVFDELATKLSVQ